ncbi:hypothetical protein [Novosphingobium sp. M1R2S20]|uniref:Uncharacterized protein n=1 Tax=Novosphingobium rhizovicinum TaxID=3228928 RepID=A0ABV3RFH3_9SPHN
MRKLLFGSIAALGLVAAPAIAQDATGTVGGGAAASTPGGSVAGGATAGAQMRDQDRKDRGKRDRRMDRTDRRADTTNSASTHGSGTIYTDRNRATGGVTAGGSATGTGDQSTSTTIDAYGATDSMGSTGEVYGDATANSTTPAPN